MTNALQHVDHLARTIGPRGSATTEEAQAAQYIEEELFAMGLASEREPFRSVSTFSWTYILMYSLFLLAALIFRFRPVWGCIISGLGLFLFLMESNTFPVVASRMPKRLSQNIRATIEPRSKAVHKVVISAHCDSSRWALNFSPSMVGSFRRSYLWMVYAMAALFGIYLAGNLFVKISPILWWISLLPAIFLLVPIGSLIHREIKGNYTPGANDNASGVAVMLETARILAKNRPISTQVEILATGCEEAGLVGMIHYLKTHSISKDTLFINLDNLGAGTVAVTTREGIAGSKPASPILLESGRDTAKTKNLTVNFRPYTLLTTDATAAIMRGFGAVSIMGIDENGLLPNWHWPTDTVENINPENLETARELVLGMLRNLDQA